LHGKVTCCLESLFGIPLSRGGSVHTVLRAASRCQPVYESIRQTVGQSDWVVPDETGWRVGGLPAWLHTLVGPGATAYVIDLSRSGAVAEAILGLDYNGTMIHDGWSPYDRFANAHHQQCLNHLLRRADEMAATATWGPSVFRVGWPSCSARAWICVTVTRPGKSAGTAWRWPAVGWRTSCPT
jgi:transposase